MGCQCRKPERELEIQTMMYSYNGADRNWNYGENEKEKDEIESIKMMSGYNGNKIIQKEEKKDKNAQLIIQNAIKSIEKTDQSFK